MSHFLGTLCCNRRHRAGLVLVARRQRASGIDRYARWLHPWVDENLSGRVAEDEVLAFYESCTARGGLVRSSEPPGGRDAYVFFKHEETPAGAVYAEELIRTAATID